ncbi:MAG: single-stranded DNA-binding protein [Eubacteriales bacterium]|jgi:primosomal replication protein N
MMWEWNQAVIRGVLREDPCYSHCQYGEDFYLLEMGVARASGTWDVLRVMLSQRLMVEELPQAGEWMEIRGQLRSYNRMETGRSKLQLMVFAGEARRAVESEGFCNRVELEGLICRQPHYRATPLGREICDLMLAVSRSYHRCDYIPCILWGRNARYMGRMGIGRRIRINGRIQSREYIKMENGLPIHRVTIEVSAVTGQLVEEIDNCQEMGYITNNNDS